MGNLPGTFALLRVLVRPRLAIPQLHVQDIRNIDFVALRDAGYKGAVFDKDNCLTVPHHDQLVPELTSAWEECKKVFGASNVLIVSNSAGASDDPAGIRAESVQHYLGVPVLRHATKKPGTHCIRSIRTYFASVSASPGPFIVVGDRVMTDVVLANRMGALGILTGRLWAREATFMRLIESGIMKAASRLTGTQPRRDGKFTRSLAVAPTETRKTNIFRKMLDWASGK